MAEQELLLRAEGFADVSRAFERLARAFQGFGRATWLCTYHTLRLSLELWTLLQHQHSPHVRGWDDLN